MSRNWILCGLVTLVLLPAGLPAGQRAFLPNGRALKGAISGTTATRIVFAASDAAAALPLDGVSRVIFDSPPRLVSTGGSPRLVVLQGGESFVAAIEGLDAKTLGVSFRGNSATLSRVALAAVRQPPHERVVAFEDFESQPTLFEINRGTLLLSDTRAQGGGTSLKMKSAGNQISHTLHEPLDAGRVELAFYDTLAVGHESTWSAEFHFAGPQGNPDDASTVRVTCGWQTGQFEVASDWTGLAVEAPPRRSGWCVLTALFDAERVLLAIDQHLLARGPALKRHLRKIELKTDVVAPDSAARNVGRPPLSPSGEPAVWLDNLLITRAFDGARPPPVNTQPHDLLWLADGDELFVDVASANARHIRIEGPSGATSIDWKHIHAIEFAHRERPKAQAVTGVVATIELAPRLGGAPLETEQLEGAITAADEQNLTVEHPWLGSLRLPCDHLSRVLPRFAGTLRLIDPRRHHLGNEIRDDFRQPLAEGPRYKVRFSLSEPPRGRLAMSLDAADLEPAGPHAPRDGRFRDELAAGFLRTEVFLNSRRVDDLNRHIDLRATPHNPQRLSLPLTPEHFKSGENTLEFVQRPARDNPREFDDFEFSRLALEIVP
jgi:hypothetical protein